MTIGAPNKAVIILIGNVPNGKTSVKIENNNIKNIPETKIQRYKIFISPVRNNVLQICGTANPIKLIGPANAVADAVNKAVEIKIVKRIFLILIPNDCAYFSPNNKAVIPRKVNNETIIPLKTNKPKTPNCSHDNPLNEPNPQTKYALILSEGAKYCIMPINAPAKPAIINPIITKEADDLIRNDNEITKNKATIAPKNEAIIVIQGLLRNSPKPIIEKRKITIATPKLAIEVIPKTEGSANGFLNNSCIKKPEIGNEIPTNKAVNDFGKRKLSTRLCNISSD